MTYKPFKEISDRYITADIRTKSGYCHRCLDERWKGATEIQKLYEYTYPKTKELHYICERHVGCLEIARHMVETEKKMNDIERQRSKRELNELIEEGMKIFRDIR